MAVTVPPLSEFQWNGTQPQQKLRADEGSEPLVRVGRQNWARLSEYARSGLTQVAIGNCNDPWVCPNCRALEAKTYPIADPPRLPLPECSSETGCRCSYLPSLR